MPLTPLFQAHFDDSTYNGQIANGTSAPIATGPDITTYATTGGDYSVRAYGTVGGAGNTATSCNIDWKMDDGNFPAGTLFANSFAMYLKFSDSRMTQDGFFVDFKTVSGSAVGFSYWSEASINKISPQFNQTYTVGTWTDVNPELLNFEATVGYEGTIIMMHFDSNTGVCTFSCSGQNGTSSVSTTLSSLTHSDALTHISMYQIGNADPVTPTLEEIRIYGDTVSNPFKAVTSITDYHNGPNTPPSGSYNSITQR